MQDKNTTTKPKTPKSFWLVASLFFIWGTLGALHFVDFLSTSVEKLVAQARLVRDNIIYLEVPDEKGRYYIEYYGGEGLKSTWGVIDYENRVNRMNPNPNSNPKNAIYTPFTLNV